GRITGDHDTTGSGRSRTPRTTTRTCTWSASGKGEEGERGRESIHPRKRLPTPFLLLLLKPQDRRRLLEGVLDHPRLDRGMRVLLGPGQDHVPRPQVLDRFVAVRRPYGRAGSEAADPAVLIALPEEMRAPDLENGKGVGSLFTPEKTPDPFSSLLPEMGKGSGVFSGVNRLPTPFLPFLLPPSSLMASLRVESRNRGV